ncbi:MAG: FlgD immunoglobulin-like domain containing protein, partial [Candidatus Latescibacterota bacterium]
TAPTLSLSQPDGVADTANTSFPIRYSLSDPDDDFGSGLLAAFYFAESGGLNTVQDIRIFGTLIADENDNTAVNSSGTNDFTEGGNQTYSWDNPPTALKNLFFASILQVPSADYFIYMVAEDGKNPPVFVRSSGTLTVRHKPLVLYVDPAVSETVDTGVRSGTRANPYDLDFAVRDYDNQGSSQVALFYSAVSGLASVSVSGTYPSQSFALGKSVSGTRAIYIENSDTLTSADTEFSWDTTDSVFVAGDSAAVIAGNYYLYVVVSDSIDIVVGESTAQISVRHSPSFVFYEPSKDTHRSINSGSQSVYTIQWQKGPGDSDFDDDAEIDFYFTTDNPVTINYEEFPDSLLKDGDTRPLVMGRTEDGGGALDMYVWDFRNPPEEVPAAGTQVWLYAVISDDEDNQSEVLGGSLTVSHTPFINLLTSDLDNLTSFDKNDVLRIAWDDYWVDDGVGTDDAYIRVYASENPSNLVTAAEVDAAVGGAATFLINSSDGSTGGTITEIRESDSNFLDWNTKLFGNASTDYDIYVAISTDETFINLTKGGIQLSKSSSPLSIGTGGSTPNISVSPTDLAIAIGDTATFDVMVQHSVPINLVQIVMTINSTDFAVLDQDSSTSGTQPFLDLGKVFSLTSAIENKFVSSGNQLRFAKSTFTGQMVGTTTQPVALARFQLVARDGLQATPSLVFSSGATGTVLGLVGSSDPLDTGGGLTAPPAELTRQARGQIAAIVELEGRTIAPATGDFTTLLDIHLRPPGSTIDLDDSIFLTANDDDLTTTDTLEVSVGATGALSLVSIPAGRYVLTVKDTSHVSGRTDTIIVRNGETVTISSGNNNGFFGSDLRGDPTALLPSSGRELIAGDVSEDNEINEDDVNLIISAWGTDDTAISFEQADINNDDIVGAADLTVTTSNFGNSQGFGAPPVYKKADIKGGIAGARNDHAALELRGITVRPNLAMAPGEVIGIEIHGRDLEDLAGYEFRIDLDETRLRPLVDRAEQGDVFTANPYGSVFEVRVEGGTLHVLSSRIGKQWSAAGEGSLAKLWFEVIDTGAEESLTLGEGVLLNTRYQPDQVAWSNSLYELLLPQQPALSVNYPNPFNPTTVIPFALHGPTDEVRLQIYNLLGQRVRTLLMGPMAPGFHTIVWNGRDDSGRQVAAGLYISELRTAEFRQTRKMTLVK